jgi:hypothetical protein
MHPGGLAELLSPPLSDRRIWLCCAWPVGCQHFTLSLPRCRPAAHHMGDPQAWPVSAVSVAETRAQATAAELAEIARIAAKEPLRSAQLCG